MHCFGYLCNNDLCISVATKTTCATKKYVIIIIIIIIIIIKIVHEVQKDRIRQKKRQNNQHVHK